MASKRTIEVTNKKWIYNVLSKGIWILTTIVLAISALKMIGGDTIEGSGEEVINVAAFKAKIFSLTTSLIIGIVASILIKDKLRTAIWMLNTVLAAVVYKSTGMYIVLVIWAIDEYVLYALYKKYSNLCVINKEMDLRE